MSTLLPVGATASSTIAAPRPDPVELRDLALDRIQQGLCVFDGQQRLLLFNRRYAEMYDLDPSQLWIGMTLRDVVDLRYAAGSGPNMSPTEYALWRDRISHASKVTDTEVSLRSGAVHAIHHEPIAGGGWVATFDDISERRRAERRVRHMAHHDALTGLPTGRCFPSGWSARSRGCVAKTGWTIIGRCPRTEPGKSPSCSSISITSRM